MTIQRYHAESYINRERRRERWAFRVPAKFAQVGEILYTTYSSHDVLNPTLDEYPINTGHRRFRIRKVDVDPKFGVRRFKVGHFTWTDWVVDEQEIFLDAEDNPVYPRGGREHDDEA